MRVLGMLGIVLGWFLIILLGNNFLSIFLLIRTIYVKKNSREN